MGLQSKHLILLSFVVCFNQIGWSETPAIFKIDPWIKTPIVETIDTKPPSGELHLADLNGFNSLSPYPFRTRSEQVPIHLRELVFEPLAINLGSFYWESFILSKIDLDEESGGTEFTLREGVTFYEKTGDRDIREFGATIDDLKFSLEMFLKRAHDNGWRDYREADISILLDKNRNSLTLKSNRRGRGLRRLINNMLSDTVLIPKAKYQWLESYTGDKLIETTPIGSGPYIVDQFDYGLNGTISYQRLDNHWSTGRFPTRALYHFKSIRVDNYIGIQSVLEATNAGRVNAMVVNDIDHFEKIPQLINQTAPFRLSVTPLKLESAPISHILFNYERLPNKSLRKAIGMVYRQGAMFSHVFSFLDDFVYPSMIMPEATIFSQSQPITPRQKSLIEEIMNDSNLNIGDIPDDFYLSDIGQIWSTPMLPGPNMSSSKIRRITLRAAAQELEKGGFKVINGALVDPETRRPVKLQFLAGSDSMDRIVGSGLAKKLFEILGIELEVISKSKSEFVKIIQKGEYDFTLMKISTTGEIPYLGSFSALFHPKSESPYKMKLDDEFFGKILDPLSSATEKSDLIDYFQLFERWYLGQYYGVPLAHPSRIWHVRQQNVAKQCATIDGHGFDDLIKGWCAN